MSEILFHLLIAVFRSLKNGVVYEYRDLEAKSLNTLLDSSAVPEYISTLFTGHFGEM
jgi:hypothetical protein